MIFTFERFCFLSSSVGKIFQQINTLFVVWYFEINDCDCTVYNIIWKCSTLPKRRRRTISNLSMSKFTKLCVQQWIVNLSNSMSSGCWSWWTSKHLCLQRFRRLFRSGVGSFWLSHKIVFTKYDSTEPYTRMWCWSSER